MKNLTLFIIIAILLSSCGKDDIQPKVDEKLNISRVILAPDRILLKKQEKFYVSLRYWKEESLSNTDEINLIINGVQAKLIKYKPNEQLVGANALFEVSPINSPGDVKVNYTIKTNNKLYTGEATLRIVEDFSISTIWDKLDKPYVKTIPFTTEVYQSGDFTIMGASVTVGGGQIIEPEPISFLIGDYRSSYQASRLLVSKPFITGLDGMYFLYYENNMLKEIRLTIGNTNVDPFFDKNEIFYQLTNSYGIPTINANKRIYQNGIYDVEVTDDNGVIRAVVKKIRPI